MHKRPVHIHKRTLRIYAKEASGERLTRFDGIAESFHLRGDLRFLGVGQPLHVTLRYQRCGIVCVCV